MPIRAELDVPALAQRARGLCGRAGRAIVGVAGPPGAGKSTLVAAVLSELGDDAVVVPMDGFHLAQVELARLGRADRKGAPDTFDGLGYVALLKRLRNQRAEAIYAPMFRRDLEEPIANAICVGPEARVVVTEGNYLLLDRSPWDQVRDLLDESWFLQVDPTVRRRRLVDRHVAFGRDEAEAQRFVMRSDEANALLVERDSDRADLVIYG